MESEEERNVLKEFKVKIFKEVETNDVVYLLRAQEVITEGECETITSLVNILYYIIMSYAEMEFWPIRNWARPIKDSSKA